MAGRDLTTLRQIDGAAAFFDNACGARTGEQSFPSPEPVSRSTGYPLFSAPGGDAARVSWAIT
jgi:hypothetical protein